tara:strand:+ start:293 stop:394 length:102 start_codon:yes stop_codon:yes gene_type:complete
VKGEMLYRKINKEEKEREEKEIKGRGIYMANDI